VPVGIVALPKELRVLGVRERGVMNPVRGVESQAAGDCYAWHV
jgi:hypothetical protein